MWVYSIFEAYSFLFAILVAMLIGNAFSPNLPTFLVVFLVSSGLLYYYWFKREKSQKIPWFRISIHTAILLSSLPILIGISALLFKFPSNTIFWLLIVPIFVLLVSFLLHNIYKISS